MLTQGHRVVMVIHEMESSISLSKHTIDLNLLFANAQCCPKSGTFLTEHIFTIFGSEKICFQKYIRVKYMQCGVIYI